MDALNLFERAMQNIMSCVAEQPIASAASRLRMAVAYSGGLDSAVLLYLANDYALRHGIELMAFHVHHGLSPNADQWVLHSQTQCAALYVPFETAYVQLGSTGAAGVEATARNKRYAALGELCNRYQVDVLLTAHHQDDQAETILLQLLRGSGVAGLCGMQQYHRAKQLLGSDVLLVRPLLEITRAELEKVATIQDLAHIEDESNDDPRYLRNALRMKIMPLLGDYFPGYQYRFARMAQHAQSTLTLIEQLAQEDYSACLVSAESAMLDAARLEILPDSRVDNVLRYWIAAHHQKMPSTARLAEMRKQLMTAKDDARVCVKHGDMEVHRYRQKLSIVNRAATAPPAQQFIWQGESCMAFPAFSGTLLFEPAAPGEPGIRRDWLLGRRLELRVRRGGERLKLAANRPNRDMKSHYQSLGIAYWKRERLPFLYSDDALIFAAGVGMHGAFLDLGEQCLVLRWKADWEWGC